MEPHSRRHHGTLLLPQALILLLRTCLAESSDDPVSPSHTDVSSSASIRTSLHLFLLRLVSYVDRRVWTSSVFVGMVELTAVCGIGSALWLWKRHRDKSERPSSSKSSKAFGPESNSAGKGALETPSAGFANHVTLSVDFCREIPTAPSSAALRYSVLYLELC
jgi:hypothetical protein